MVFIILACLFRVPYAIEFWIIVGMVNYGLV